MNEICKNCNHAKDYDSKQKTYLCSKAVDYDSIGGIWLKSKVEDDTVAYPASEDESGASLFVGENFGCIHFFLRNKHPFLKFMPVCLVILFLYYL